MRVLWFTNNSSCYKTKKNGYNGGGWISSLEKEIKKNKNIELGICFHSQNKEAFKIKQNNVLYYPICNYSNFIEKIYNKIITSSQILDKKDIKHYLKVIEDFKPDIINIFGSEKNFGLLSTYISTPIVLHIQGILTPCQTAYCPPGYSQNDIIFRYKNPIKIMLEYRNLYNWKKDSLREQQMLINIPYIMGRTEWDKRLSSIYAPNSRYYHCNEILRECFYNPSMKRKVLSRLSITTTISSPLYKGFDTILQAANILKEKFKLDFEWNVYGINDIKHYENRFKIKAANCNINIKGIVNQDELSQRILESTVFVHPSYIDNSPNSVCEAQILGCPVIATNVGGIPSLIENERTGFLIPANDPYQMAYLINRIYIEKEWAEKIGKEAQRIALIRHNKAEIAKRLMCIYEDIIKT